MFACSMAAVQASVHESRACTDTSHRYFWPPQQLLETEGIRLQGKHSACSNLLGDLFFIVALVQLMSKEELDVAEGF